MIDAHKAKISKFDKVYVFTDEFGYAQLSLTFIANEYGINKDDAKKICIANKGITREGYYGHWYFPTEDNAISALIMLKLMR